MAAIRLKRGRVDRWSANLEKAMRLVESVRDDALHYRGVANGGRYARLSELRDATQVMLDACEAADAAIARVRSEFKVTMP